MNRDCQNICLSNKYFPQLLFFLPKNVEIKKICCFSNLTISTKMTRTYLRLRTSATKLSVSELKYKNVGSHIKKISVK